MNRGDETPEELVALRRQRQRMSVPQNEAGGVVFVEPVVFRSAECALQLETTRVFSTGVQFQFRVLVRKQTAQQPGQAPTVPPMLGMGRAGDDALWVGVKLADGRKATNAGGRPPLLSYFLTPAPPPGSVTLVLAWPTFDIEESALVIPADELAAAATRRVTLWPEQPEDERFNPPRPPRPPMGGWFEQNPPAGSSSD